MAVAWKHSLQALNYTETDCLALSRTFSHAFFCHSCVLHFQHICLSNLAHPSHGDQQVKNAATLWYAACSDIRVQKMKVNRSQ